ncbi:MAG TPA: chromosomal replication initiator protein DnaA [Candidatus Ventrousia excrementavium]|uniref:Chromosomal replication initiator protein DnaA n=1 Tax=Candidatus Ventrousia excrementavium TaxID=2840961 RepID=A0A9D1LMB8_9CLOT|nr:chromosomal replication initiator protein DnaA [Candidatus Ventrousia excrementavium]
MLYYRIVVFYAPHVRAVWKEKEEIALYTPSALLDAVIKILERDLGEVIVSTWFSDAEAIAIKNGHLVIYTPNEVKRETMQKHYFDNVSQAIYELLGERLTPLYLCGEEELAVWRLENEDSVYSHYTFAKFIVGPSNRFAHAAALAVANSPAAVYNPLFIYGQSGLGKTHLLYAIAGELRRRHSGMRVVYVKGDEFTNDLVSSIQSGTVAEFRNKYRQADLFLVDDIQFIAGKVQTQEEFFHTFNTMHEAGKQIVLTSDRPPKEILTLEERLRTRFEWGLLADIQPPDLETRMAMISAKARDLGMSLTPKIVQYVAESIQSNVRQLEGAVKKIYAYHSLMGRALDMEMAQDAIRDIFRENPGAHPTPDLILQEVASFYSIPAERIRGSAKTRDVVGPRQAAIYLIREMTGMSLPEIGKFMGRDHTTALYAINKIEERLKNEPELQNEIADMKKNIQNR